MKNELKRCPFCNGAAELDTMRGYRNISTGKMENAIAIYCLECGADISVCRGDVPDIEPEQLAEMWNKRNNVGDLVSLVNRLAHSLRKAVPSHDLPEKALDYLQREGLIGSPLRETANALAQADAACGVSPGAMGSAAVTTKNGD